MTIIIIFIRSRKVHNYKYTKLAIKSNQKVKTRTLRKSNITHSLHVADNVELIPWMSHPHKLNEGSLIKLIQVMHELYIYHIGSSK